MNRHIHRAIALAMLLSSGLATRPLCTAAEPSTAPFTIDSWDTEQSSVIALTQTDDGYLWLGTLAGLVRFDGIQFRVFDEANTPGLNSSRIVSLFEDSRRRLWIGTETAGIALAEHGKVTSLGIGRGSREGRLLSVCEDTRGSIWLYLANGQLFRWQNEAADLFLPGPGLPSYCRRIVPDDSGKLWLGMDGRQFQFDPLAATNPPALAMAQTVRVSRRLDYLLASRDGGYWRLADGVVQKWRGNRLERELGPYPWRPTARVSSACEDLQGNLIVGTVYENDGVYWFDAQGQATHISRKQGLSHDGVLSLAMDREGSLWVGTDGGGLNRVKRKTFSEPLPVPRGVVQSVCEDAQGGLWLGYNNGGARYWKGDNLLEYGRAEGLHPDVWAVFTDRKQRVWAGTWGGLFTLLDGRFQRIPGPDAIQRAVLAIFEDRQGTLWFGTQDGLARWDENHWRIFTTADGLSADFVRAIAEDADGNLWIGTEDGGLNQWRDGRFTTFRKQEGGLPSDRISSLHVDGEGVLWIGTGSGLVRFHQGRWTRYTTREGLVSNSIGYLLEDGQGYLWVGSTAGLMRLATSDLNALARGQTNVIACRAYGKAEGLPSQECTQGSQPAAARTRAQHLYFPTINGLASVNPDQLHPNTNPPPVMIESVALDGRAQSTDALRAPTPSQVTIPAGRERLEIRYTSLNLAAPERARFKYRMEGHESGWTEAGDLRIVRYSKLPPGRYRFQVTAANEDGLWNDAGATLAVTVLPPFWRTWWFVTAVSAFLLGSVIAIVHFLSTQKLQRQLVRLKHEEALDKERSRIARDMHDQLGANLTQIGFLGEMIESDREEPAEVSDHARQITQTARETTRALDEIVWAVNPSNDTLDGLVTYVCKNAQEYLGVAGIRYRLEVPDQLPKSPLPPDVRHNVFLAAKEAVTNVVRHAQASEVHLRLRLQPGRFILEIEDNGRGLADFNEQKARTRNGLANMRKRMEDIGGEFAFTPAPVAGTLIRLAAPVSNPSPRTRAG